MKILVSRISPGAIGGAELSAFDQVVVLNELGHKAVFVTNLRPLVRRAKKLGIKTYWFPWTNRGPGKLRLIFFALTLPFTYPLALLLVARIRPDVINPHSREDQMAFTFTKFLHRTPVVWKVPGDSRDQLAVIDPMSKQPKNRAKMLYRGLLLRATRRADHLYLLNSEDIEDLVGHTGEQMRPLVSAVPASILYRDYDRSAKPLPKKEGVLVVGSTARLEENKGIHYLTEAIRQIGCSKDVEYWQIDAYGLWQDKIKDMVKDLDCFKFIPYTDNMSPYLNSFDILVHPVEAEGWGRIIKEAMYFGLPIIGSRVGGVKLQIEDGKTGLLFDVGDVAELKKLLLDLIGDKKLRERLGENARAKAEKDGDFVAIVKEQILPIYEKAAGTKT